MDKEKNFDDVLKKAKELGYAESNPSADLNGEDEVKVRYHHPYVEFF